MATILLVGTEKDKAVGVRSLLRQDRHFVTWLRSEPRWREVEREISPEVIVATASAPETLFSVPGRRTARGFPAPLLLVRPEGALRREIKVEERLVDEIETPFTAEEMLGRVDALIRVRRVVRHEDVVAPDTSEEPRPAEGGLRTLGMRLASILGARVPPYQKPLGPYLEVASRVAEWAECRDAFEPGHAERVASLCAMMAEELQFSESDSANLLRAAMLHDIGKVTLPVEVLQRKGPLEEEQMRLLRTHPGRGAALLRALDPDEGLIDTILYHHERSDGGGYYGKAGESIPRPARVLAVAEVFDAMTSSRVRKPLDWQSALEHLREKSGEAFDPACVEALVKVLQPRKRTIPPSPSAS
jgi:putative nucleotidyltransferase with HDIG domain